MSLIFLSDEDTDYVVCSGSRGVDWGLTLSKPSSPGHLFRLRVSSLFTAKKARYMLMLELSRLFFLRRDCHFIYCETKHNVSASSIRIF